MSRRLPQLRIQQTAVDDAPLAGVRIICVDDDEDWLELLSLGLRNAGADVVAYSSSIEGLEAIATTDFDVLVSDLRMPDMTGVELLGHARDLAVAFPTLAIAVTGESGWIDEALRSGFQRVMLKPVDIATVAVTIGTLRAAAPTEAPLSEGDRLRRELAALHGGLRTAIDAYQRARARIRNAQVLATLEHHETFLRAQVERLAEHVDEPTAAPPEAWTGRPSVDDERSESAWIAALQIVALQTSRLYKRCLNAAHPSAAPLEFFAQLQRAASEILVHRSSLLICKVQSRFSGRR